jgi:hypothetical protein
MVVLAEVLRLLASVQRSEEVRHIYKYILNDKIEMPEGAQILSVQVQQNIPVLWAMVDPEAPKRDYYFDILPTGVVTNHKKLDYIGTIQTHGGSIILHVFSHFTY